ncbi:hypothetical protein ACOME3_004711 [Neoechinorhynchus agilis]
MIDEAISQAAQAHLISKDTVQYPSIQSNSNSNTETYLDLPIKKMAACDHNFVLSSASKRDREIIRSISYYAEKLKIYFTNNVHSNNFKEFAANRCDNSGVTISTGTYDSTFLVSGLSPGIDLSDREEFEAKFRCQILFFLKSIKSGKPIPRAVLKANVDTRNKLTAQRCFFQGMEVKFLSNDISNQDDFHFPRCSGCQKWVHWSQKCPNKSIVCPYCAQNH